MQLSNLIKAIYYKLISPMKYANIVGVTMGNNCEIRTKFFGSEPYLIKLGNNVATSGNVQFVTHDGSLHVLRNLYSEHKNKDFIRRINIGNNVFIGLNVIILPGTIIEDNVIIGAGSVVKGNIKGNSVYAGIPAKFICTINEYENKNKRFFINTKNLSSIEKKNYIKNINDI